MSDAIWQKNMDALDTRYSLLKDALLKYRVEVLQSTEINNDEALVTYGIASIADRKVLYAMKDEVTIQLDSLYDTDKMIALWMKNQPTIGYMTKCIFCGFGNGMYARKILQEADSTMSVLVYEPSIELLATVMEEYELEEVLRSERFTLLVKDCFPLSIKEYLYKFVDYRDLEKLIYQAYPNYDKFMKREVNEMDAEIQVMYNTIRATQSVMARYGKSYFYNSIINIPWFIQSKSITSFFQKCPKNIPVFIIASGPSLDKNIEELKKVKGKGLILAVDSAIKPLLAHDILPDMYLSVDAVKQLAHFADERVTNIPAIYQLSSNNNVVRKHKKEIYFINDLNSYMNDYLTKNQILLPVFSSGGSVANTAFAIVASMGFETIILVGQDLAYTNNKTHSSATVRGALNSDTSMLEGMMIEGYYGDQVKSSYEFQLYLRWFEDQIQKEKDILVMNATEGGAMIHGAKNISLQDAILQFCLVEVNIEEIIRSTDDLFNDNQQTELTEYIYELISELRELRIITIQGIRDYEKMEELASRNKINSTEMIKMLKSTNVITEKIDTSPAMYYIQNLMQIETQQFLQEVYNTEENFRDEVISAAGKGKKYLEIVKNTIEGAIPEVKRVLDLSFLEYTTSMKK